MPSVKQRIQSYFRFCPHCGSRSKLHRVHDTHELHCPKCGYTFWMNSKPTASALIIRNGKVLLTKRAISPFKGQWDIPGGFLDVHEDPITGLQREMHEELGIRVSKPKFLSVYVGMYPSTPPQSTLNLYYVVTKYTGTLKPQDDVAAFAWQSLRRLPKKLAFGNNRQALRDFVKMTKRNIV